MPLEALGWTDFFSRSLNNLGPELRAARVASENRGHYCVWSTTEEVHTRLAGAWTGERPVTGDWVALDSSSTIQAVLPRKTQISRKRAGRGWEKQILAANIDVLFLVSGLDHDFNPRRLERYLLLAEESGARSVIVLNKSDLCGDPLEKMRVAESVGRGVPIVLSCGYDEASVAQLGRYVDIGETAALLGSSGAGKSTIANALLGRQAQSIRPVRESDSRGRHTTSGRQLFQLQAGWLLIDTPGLRELEPWASTEAAQALFSDIEDTAKDCRFRDCRHEGEPGCAVLMALEQGLLDPGRLDGFTKLRKEMEHLKVMTDIHAAQEQKRKWKQIHKAMRNFSKG